MSGSTASHSVYLNLGSNIHPETNIPRAVELLNQMVDIQAVSDVWETTAVGSSGPNFLNCAVLIRTALSKMKLKEDVLSAVEERLGRIRTEDKNAPRTIDIDPVVWEGEIEDQQLFSEPFLALPMNDLIPDIIDPNTGFPLCQFAQDLSKSRFVKKRPDVKVSVVY